MAGNLTQKERTILQDQMRHEEVCINKYRDYAARTSDSTLRGLFNEFAQDEQEHHNTLSGMLGGSSGQSTKGTTGQGQGSNRSFAKNISDEEFIRAAADERLQAKGLGQLQQPSETSKSQQWGTSQQGQQQNPQLGQQLTGQHQQSQQGQQLTGQRQQQQSSQRSQSTNWPETFQEASRELIPMFKSETAQEFAGGTGIGESNASIVRDMLMTEQFVSGSYDSAIFDSVSPETRQALQHIQKDEQKHGQGLRDYMQRKGLGQQ